MRRIDPLDKVAIMLLEAEVEELEATARRFLSQINRSPETPGYSLETRKEAARITLMDQGYSASAAEQMVDDMVQYGTLPDPPLR